MTPGAGTRPLRFRDAGLGYQAAMSVMTKRNAVIGWIALRVARRRVEKMLGSVVKAPPRRRRRRLLAGLGLTAAAGATMVAMVARRDHSRPSGASA
jgi:hypothetical protein